MIESCSLDALERAIFSSINQVILPGIRSGWLSPSTPPTTAIAVAVPGRASGKIRTVPLLALQLGDVLLVATFRGGRSQWVRNVAAAAKVKIWLGGHPAHYRATVISSTRKSGRPRGWVSRLVDALEPATAIGWAFAIFEPSAARKPKRAKSRRRSAAPKLATA